MGAGKSKVAPLLAELLNCSWHDIDKLIEQKAGKKIAEIFEQEGEKVFRQLESETIRELTLLKSKTIISLGGGALVMLENRKIAQEHGVVIYLKSSPQAIFERVKHSKKRPLLNIQEDENFEENLLKKITELLEDRKKMYESADIVIDRDNLPPMQVAQKIFKELIKYEKN